MDRGTDRAFLDLLFNCLLGFVFLFFVAFAMVEIDKKAADIRTKAEFVVTLTWDLQSPDDIDTWLRDPAGNVVWFKAKECGLMHLDRDDVGQGSDTYHLPDGTTMAYPYNQEITTIRGIVPGEWVLNLHMYAKRRPDPATARVEMVKLNPVHRLIFAKEFTMAEKAEELTVARFEMAPGGEIVSIDETPAAIVSQYLWVRGLRE